MPAPRNYSPYQQKIIGRYYDNIEQIDQQRLGDLVANLYLADGKKREKLWKQAGEVMERLGVPQSRLDHVLKTATIKRSIQNESADVFHFCASSCSFRRISRLISARSSGDTSTPSSKQHTRSPTSPANSRSVRSVSIRRLT